MDEAIWATIGIISAILALGIVGNLLVRHNVETDSAHVQTALDVLSAQCEQVCGLPEGTALSVAVTLPPDVVLSADGERLCAETISGERSCARCTCRHQTDGIVLDLTGAGAFYESHEFRCRYERVDTRNTAQRVELNCTG